MKVAWIFLTLLLTTLSLIDGAVLRHPKFDLSKASSSLEPEPSNVPDQIDFDKLLVQTQESFNMNNCRLGNERCREESSSCLFCGLGFGFA